MTGTEIIAACIGVVILATIGVFIWGLTRHQGGAKSHGRS